MKKLKFDNKAAKIFKLFVFLVFTKIIKYFNLLVL